jgi:hypothetical protein
MGGPGVIVVDDVAGVLAVAKLHYASDSDATTVAKAVAASAPPRAKAKLVLGPLVFVFDAAYSQQTIAQLNWQQASLALAVLSSLAAASSGAIRVPDQAAPGGAFARLPAGEYAISYDGDAELCGGASVVWLSRTRS